MVTHKMGAMMDIPNPSQNKPNKTEEYGWWFHTSSTTINRYTSAITYLYIHTLSKVIYILKYFKEFKWWCNITLIEVFHNGVVLFNKTPL